MSDNKYHFTRDGNHVKLISKSQIQDDSESSSLITPKKAKRSIWSMVSIFFSWFFAGLVMVISFLIATPFFFLLFLINWIKLSIGFSIFWAIIYIVYDSIILNSSSLDVRPFNNMVILTIMALGLVASIFLTIAEAKD